MICPGCFWQIDLRSRSRLCNKLSRYGPVPLIKRCVTILVCPVEVLRGSETVPQCHTTLRGPDRAESGSWFLPRPVKTAACCVANLSRLISDRIQTWHRRLSHQLLVQPGLAKWTYINKQCLDETWPFFLSSYLPRWSIGHDERLASL